MAEAEHVMVQVVVPRDRLHEVFKIMSDTRTHGGFVPGGPEVPGAVVVDVQLGIVPALIAVFGPVRFELDYPPPAQVTWSQEGQA